MSGIDVNQNVAVDVRAVIAPGSREAVPIGSKSNRLTKNPITNPYTVCIPQERRVLQLVRIVPQVLPRAKTDIAGPGIVKFIQHLRMVAVVSYRHRGHASRLRRCAGRRF